MITKERRSQLREQWETEYGYADEWRADLTEEERFLVATWDWTRRLEEDRVARAYWQERRREA